jgi:hypothetical protein
MSLKPENPLTKFRLANPRWTWQEMSDITGITSVTLIKMATKQREKLATMQLETYLKIKEKLGVDMLADYGPEPYDPYVKKTNTAGK